MLCAWTLLHLMKSGSCSSRSLTVARMRLVTGAFLVAGAVVIVLDGVSGHALGGPRSRADWTVAALLGVPGAVLLGFGVRADRPVLRQRQ